MAEPRWLVAARKQVGEREIHGRKHNPKILQWWVAIRASFTDDETPWCAGFTGGILESVGIKSSRSAAALSYDAWGVKLRRPAMGAIAVFRRKGGGHVGFYVGKTPRGIPLILGGNQSDKVSIAPIYLEVVGYRWPAGEPLPDADNTVIKTDITAETKVT